MIARKAGERQNRVEKHSVAAFISPVKMKELAYRAFRLERNIATILLPARRFRDATRQALEPGGISDTAGITSTYVVYSVTTATSWRDRGY